MIGTEELIEQVLLKWGRGRIFFIRDIELNESPESIRHALSSLTEKRKILRLARGVYCFPKIVGEYTFRTVYPTDEEVAQAVAAHSGIRIIPFCISARKKTGFILFLKSMSYNIHPKSRLSEIGFSERVSSRSSN